MKPQKLAITLFLSIVISKTAECQKSDRLQPECQVVLLRDLRSGYVYRIVFYNNSDSVLCLLTSVSGTYKIKFPEALLLSSNFDDTLIYNLDRVANDTLVTSYYPVKRKICILPFQSKEVEIVIPRKGSYNYCKVGYFYTDKLCYNLKKPEKYKPLWYSSFDIRFLALKLALP